MALAACAASLALVLFATKCAAAFGVYPGDAIYTVDTGGGLVFKVNVVSGDIVSLNYKGVECQAADKRTHIASGLGSATVSVNQYGNSSIKITLSTSPSNTVVHSLTHYLMVTNGVNAIFMATYAAEEPAVGELRWITRLQSAKVTNGPGPSDIRNTTNAIESSDVFGLAAGTTRSKYYGDTATHGKDRAMDLTYCGASGNGVGIWMVYDTPRESASGGPFYRDIQNQCGTDQEVYNYMNSGHEQTEAWRTNVLHGPYALVFTDGQPPNLPLDYSWIEKGGLSLLGWVPASGRGAASGIASGIPAGFQGVVGFANTTAQYWAVVQTNGWYHTPLMKPGTYDVTLYKGELEVAAGTVTVAAGATNQLNIASTESAPMPALQFGEWDGTPGGFLNSTRIISMHPSDGRMSDWGPATLTAGVDTEAHFPMACWKDTNNPTTIHFNLTAQQISTMTLRIGITCANAGGRPKPSINSWTPGNPSPSSQPNSRSLTVGTYRGNNALYSFTVPSSAFVVGQNTMQLTVISGSSGTAFLSPGCAYDAVELDLPGSQPPPAAPFFLTATNGGASRINLAWMDASTNEVNFLIERGTDGINFTLIAAILAGVTNYADEGLSAGQTYCYRVKAANGAGASPYSNAATVSTLSAFEAWQFIYFGCGTCPESAPLNDPDGDGMGNYSEFLAGSNPTNSTSRVAMLAPQFSGDNLILQWSTTRGHTNYVQRAAGSGGLTGSPQFTDLSGAIFYSGTGDVTASYPHLGGATNQPAAFYRVRIIP